jgi:hypothetical protein
MSWLVLTVRYGKALRLEWFADHEAALEAAGLTATQKENR